MKSNWIKPNLNGGILYICAVLFLLLIYFIFVPVQVTSTFNLQEDSEPFTVTEHSLVWLIFLFLGILAYPVSMRLGCGIAKQEKISLLSFFQFYIFFIVVLAFEILCAFLAYHTIGEVIHGLYFIVIVALNLIFIVISIRSRIIASLLTFILSMLIIPLQVYLGIHLYRVQVEASRVVTYAYEYKLNNGQFPNDLSGYKFNDSDMKDYIHLLLAGESKDILVVNYWVGTDTALHWYSSEGGWNYYPD